MRGSTGSRAPSCATTARPRTWCRRPMCGPIGKLGEFRGDSSLSTWLTRIALNEALGRIRQRRPSERTIRRRRGAAPNRGEVIWFPGMPNDADPERAVARREISGLLERAIDALPEAFRVVFMHARRRRHERRGDGRGARHPRGDGEDAPASRAATAARDDPGGARSGCRRCLSVRRHAAARARPKSCSSASASRSRRPERRDDLTRNFHLNLKEDAMKALLRMTFAASISEPCRAGDRAGNGPSGRSL